MHPTVNKSRGFVLAEAVLLLIIVVVLGMLVVVWAAESRRQGSLGTSLANLKELSGAMAAYGPDNADRIASYSWRAGVDYGFGGIAANDLQAAANQAVDIMRRRGDPEMQQIVAWIPHILYNHLVLADYLDLALPHRPWASPEDAQLLAWHDDPATLPPGNHNRRLRFQSSYELPPAFYSPDAQVGQVGTLSQGNNHRTFLIPAQVPLGNRRLSEVALPAQKAMTFDRFQRHFGPRQAFFGYLEARIPLALADGSADVRSSAASNRGFNPSTPTSPGASRYPYEPGEFEPPTLSGAASELVWGVYRWTRSGLRGRDFGGPEVPWQN